MEYFLAELRRHELPTATAPETNTRPIVLDMVALAGLTPQDEPDLHFFLRTEHLRVLLTLYSSYPLQGAFASVSVGAESLMLR